MVKSSQLSSSTKILHTHANGERVGGFALDYCIYA